jgi:hypothetical protein
MMLVRYQGELAGFVRATRYGLSPELARGARERVQPVVSTLVDRAHAAGRLHPDIGASDFAVIPLLINPVVNASRGASPNLWRRWLAIVREGIATGRRAPSFPGRAPAVDDVEEIIASKPPRRRAARSCG